MITKLIFAALVATQPNAYAGTASTMSTPELINQFSGVYHRHSTFGQLIHAMKTQLPEPAYFSLEKRARTWMKKPLPELTSSHNKLVFQQGNEKVTMVITSLKDGEFTINGNAVKCERATQLEACLDRVEKALSMTTTSWTDWILPKAEAQAAIKLGGAVLFWGAIGGTLVYAFARHQYDKAEAPACGQQIQALRDLLAKGPYMVTDVCGNMFSPSLKLRKPGDPRIYEVYTTSADHFDENHYEPHPPVDGHAFKTQYVREYKYSGDRLTSYNEEYSAPNTEIMVPSQKVNLESPDGPGKLQSMAKDVALNRELMSYAYANYSCGKCSSEMKHDLVGWTPTGSSQPGSGAGSGAQSNR